MITVDDIIAPGQKVIDTFHEVANIFPMMYDDEFKEFVEDIRINGLKQPILTYQGKIIDGRNRFYACIMNNIEPRFEEWDGKGSLLDCVLSLNLKRRHLTSSQRAMVALELEKQLAKENKIGRPANDGNISVISGESRQQAASIVGTNAHYVTDAKRLTIEAPELAKYVLDGSLTIPQAKAIVHRELVSPDHDRIESRGVPAALLSSDSNEWYTPETYINAA